MTLLLLDARGVIVGTSAGADAASAADRPPLLHGLALGQSVPERLQAMAAGGDVDAAACGRALLALLARRIDRFERPIGSPGWVIIAELMASGAPVAVVCRLRRLDPAQSEIGRLREALAGADRHLTQVQSVGGLASWTFDLTTRKANWDDLMYRLARRDPAKGPYRSTELRARCHPDDLAGLIEARNRTYAGEPDVKAQFRLRCDDGLERWVETRVSLLGAAGGAPGIVVGTVRDVTEWIDLKQGLERHRDQLEQLVVNRTVALAEAGARAERADRVRSGFLADTSHELRTPLNVIISLAHLMQRDSADAIGAARARAVDHAARHLASIVDDALSRAHQGDRSHPAAVQPLAPRLLLDEVVTMMGPQAQARGLRFELDPDPPELGALGVLGEAARLRQALLDAARWAVQRAPAGAVRAGLQAGPVVKGRVPLRFRVDAEVGPAAAPSHEEPIASVPGSDLDGVARAMHALGGRWGLEPAPQGGTRCWFEVTLPIAGAAPAKTPRPTDDLLATLRDRHAGRRVLLAEDDEVNQLAMVELLADAGLIVDTAADGREAVDLASRRDYALMLLDLRMPRLDGLSAARAIRALPGLQHTPLVAITAHAFDEDRQACRAAGMNDFLPKPIEVQRLYETVGHWLDARPHSAPMVPSRPGAAAASAATRGLAGPSAAEGHEALAELAPLLGLDGIDAVGGLASVGGKPAVYRRLLGVFARTHADDAGALASQLDRADAAGAAALAHRVRGSAATLGLIDVETAAAAVEHALEAGADAGQLELLAGAFSQALEATLARLGGALDTDAAEPFDQRA